MPVLVVYCSALELVLQLGIENAVGAADELVKFEMTVLAAIGAIALMPIPPHAGGLEAPVETTTCPDVEPVGFSS